MFPNLILPFYHTISSEELPHIWPLYDLYNVDEFEEHLNFFSKKFDFVSAGELKQLLDGSQSKFSKPKVFLSFDDGLKECSTVIAPILKEKGIPATFFINPSFIDSEEVFYRYKVGVLVDRLQKEQIEQTVTDELKFMLSECGKLKYTLEDSFLSMDYTDLEVINDSLRIAGIQMDNSKIYMSKDEIRSLSESGFSIGGHSMKHAHFSLLSEQEQLREVKESVDFCQQNFDQKLRLFAFPFYDFDLPKSLFKKMNDELNIDLSFGTSGIKKDTMKRNLQRLDMEQLNGSIAKEMKMEQLKYQLKKVINKHIISRS